MTEPSPNLASNGGAPDARTDADDFDPTRAELLAIVRATSDLVLVIDRDGRYVRVGPGARDTLFRPARELLGRTFDEVFSPELARRFLTVVCRALDTGVTQEHDYPLDIGGAMHTFHATVAPTGEGTVVWIARDVTERRAAEGARRAIEDTFRLLAEHSTDLVCLHAPDGRYEYVSPSVTGLLERTPEELVGTHAYDLIHPEDAPRVRSEAHDVALVGLQPPPTIYRIRAGSGDWVWFETVTRPILDESGAVVRLLTSSRDVTERRASEQALEAAALRDELTGVYNRRGFLAEAERALARAQRQRSGVILVCVDVDDLKPINDRYGHDEGDAVLQCAADVLRGTVRDGDVLGRLGGDEFAMLLVPPAHGPRGAATADAEAFARRIRERLARQLAEQDARARADGRAWSIAMSAGVVVLPTAPAGAPAAALRELLREADRLLYDDKRARKAGVGD
jgi:diguanylate cyclase (GGDEF)-like protein/PAS domain S-box-containing protein